MRNVVLHIAVVLLYLLITSVLLYPFPLYLASGVLDVHSGDPLIQIWVVQWNIHKLSTSLEHYFDANIFYPYQNTFAYHDHMFGLGLLGLPIYWLSQNPIFTYNILLLLSFVFSAYGMFLLCKEITRNTYAAFIAGLIFGFLPYRFAHLDHLNLLSIQWLPLCLLFLTKYLFSRTTTWKTTYTITTFALFWACYLLQVLSSFNYLFLLPLTIGLYVAFTLFFQWRRAIQLSAFSSGRDILLFLSGGCLVGVILLPFIFPYLKANREMRFQRTIAETEALSARVQDYGVAPETNLLYGEISRQWQSATSPFPREQILFSGLLPLILALFGIFGGRNRNHHFSLRFEPLTAHADFPLPTLRLTFLALLVSALILSFGPTAVISGKTFSLPYGWLYTYVPGFKSMRVPARFGLLVAFSIAGLAAIGVVRLENALQRFRRSRKQILISYLLKGCLGALILLEYYSPVKHINFYPGTIAAIPAVYQWLAQQPEGLRVIELPVQSARDNFEYTYYSTFHWKRMINGRSAFIPNGITQIFEEMQAFPAPKTIELLRNLEIHYVLLHTKKLEGKLPDILPTGISLQQTFDNDLLLKISQPQQLTLSEPHSHLFHVDYQIPSSLQSGQQYTMGVLITSNLQQAYSPLPRENVSIQLEWKKLFSELGRKEKEQRFNKELGEISLPIFFQYGETTAVPMHFTTPREPGEYQLLLQPQDGRFKRPPTPKQVTVLRDVLDSRSPGKLQAQFLWADIPDIWKPEHPLPIQIVVKNTGDTLWRAWVEDRDHPKGEVRLGVIDWYEASSGRSFQESRGFSLGARELLKYDIAPGEVTRIMAEIPTPPLAGEYIVEIDMVSEHVQWFSQHDSQSFKKKITLE